MINVSVIIPVYNAEKYIAKAIESCLQLPEVKEIVVIDDGYQDGAKNIVKTLAETHPLIKLYEHPNNENKGAGASRNLGIEKATQEYIAFLDADDFYLPNRFKKDKKIFKQNKDADGCYNAIGSFFYSQSAKQQFQQSFSNEITAVNEKTNPTPENVFSGLLGLISNYGYFSLDGLSVKRESLNKMNALMMNSSMHEDTDFIIRMSYYLVLFPSELNIPVALRGVHEENRITANDLDIEKKYANRYKLWNHLYTWSVKTKLKNEEKNHIKKNRDVYYAFQYNPKNIVSFIRNIVLKRNVFKSRSFQPLFKKYLGKHTYSSKLYMILDNIRKFT